MKPNVIRTQNFVHDAAEFILQHARTALAERDQFRIALSGGNTPRPIYTEFARIGRELPWDRLFFTFGDERCVPPDDAQSNFRMARESLFVLAAVPEKSKARLEAEGRFQRPIVTFIQPAPTFYPAEDYHQRYLEKRGMVHCAI